MTTSDYHSSAKHASTIVGFDGTISTGLTSEIERSSNVQYDGHGPPNEHGSRDWTIFCAHMKKIQWGLNPSIPPPLDTPVV